MAEIYLPETDTRANHFDKLNRTLNELAAASGGSGGLTNDELRATPVDVVGPATNAELRATPLPVSGTVTATGPLTNAQLRATPVPVSGGITDTELRATPVPMVPMLSSSGNIEIVVPTADTPVQLPAQACKQVVLANNSVKPGWVIQGGKKFPLFAQAYMSFFGITNTNQLSVQLPEAGDVYAHWES